MEFASEVGCSRGRKRKHRELRAEEEAAEVHETQSDGKKTSRKSVSDSLKKAN
jgi:hypothetical protein